jgi:hypothetical protein
MSDFVDECRREWKRLRVPAGPADEMADDLAADLREAEAEGADAEEVLGDGASDARAFAAAWARERGLVRRHWSDRFRTRRSLLISALVVAGSIGVATAMLVSSRGSGEPVRVPTAMTEQPSTTSPAAFVPNTRRIIGTSIERARLMPGRVVLSPNVRLRHALDRPPTSITAWVHNAGTVGLGPITLVIEAAGRRSVRSITGLAVNHDRAISVRLPRRLPRRFTIRVFTRLARGETNPSNNRAAWTVRLRR